MFHFSNQCLLSTLNNNNTTCIASRSDSSSEPSDPRGGKQPRPVCGGLHHWETECLGSLWTSPGELSIMLQRGQLNALTATPHHLHLLLTDRAVTEPGPSILTRSNCSPQKPHGAIMSSFHCKPHKKIVQFFFFFCHFKTMWVLWATLKIWFRISHSVIGVRFRDSGLTSDR